jgi:hypothetical protein
MALGGTELVGQRPLTHRPTAHLQVSLAKRASAPRHPCLLPVQYRTNCALAAPKLAGAARPEQYCGICQDGQGKAHRHNQRGNIRDASTANEQRPGGRSDPGTGHADSSQADHVTGSKVDSPGLEHDAVS